VSDTSRHSPDTLPTELRLSLDWELWVVEQLLFSGKREGLVHTLAQQGVAPELARERVLEIHGSPGFRRLERRIGEAQLAAKLQRLQDELEREHATAGVTVRADIDASSLLAEHWVRSRPLLLTEAVRDMQAVREWSLQGLAARFPELEIEVNVDRLAAARPDDTETRARTLSLRELVTRAEAAPSNDFYVVSRNGLFSRPELAPLWDELAPLPPFLSAPRFPHGASVWIGPAGTITPPHFDPHNVLLVQVQGKKRVRLAPRVRCSLHAELHGYYLGAPLDEVFAPEAILTVELQAGQALFVPVAWFHEVTSLEPSITLSFVGFVWPNHFHWLGPAGAADR
jgi:ribosomal protein L16 Arg81 hydroxylase